MAFFDDSTFDSGFHFTGLGPEVFGLPLLAEDYLSAVARRIGYGPGGIPTKAKSDMIEAVLLRGLDAVSLAGLGKPTAIDRWRGSEITAGPVGVKSPRWAHVAGQAAGPRQLYCFALTLGAGFDRLKEQSGIFGAYVLDGLGSEMVERAADEVENQLRRLYAARGLACSRRFSPGYCDWPLAQGQQALAAFLKPAAVGITVLATGAMTPSKSITAAVITAQSLPLACPCPVCQQADCPWRRQ